MPTKSNAKAKKQTDYDNLIDFYASLDDWNIKGFDTYKRAKELLEILKGK